MVGSGTALSYRRITRSAGPEPYANPPRIGGAMMLAATLNAAASSMTITAQSLAGRVVSGDRFQIGATTFEASAVAQDDGANRIVVPLTFAAPTTIASGTAVAPIWSADKRVRGIVSPMRRQLREDVLLEMRDLEVTVAARDLSFEPFPQDRVILPDGDSREVVAIIPLMADGIAYAWRLQVR
jgi:hypothetical protein